MKYSDIALPEFQLDPYYGKTQEMLFPFYSDILAGKPSEYFAPIGEYGGKEFEDVLGMTTRDITQRGLETGARLKMRGPRLGAGIARAVGDISKQLRYEDYSRAMEGRKGLLTTGLTGMEGVRGAGLNLTGMRSQFELGKTGLAMNLAQAEEAKKKAKADRWAKIIESTIKGGAIMAAMALPGGGATASTMARGGAGGGGGTQFGGGSYDLQNILYGMK